MTCQHVLFCQNYPRYQRFSFLTRAAGWFGVGPQADKNRLTAESKCGDAGNRASKVFGSQGTQRRARTETCLRLAKLSLSLGLCYGNCTKSGKKVDRFAKRKLSFLERKLMFNNLHCVIFFRSLKGRGYRITAVFFHPRRKSSEILSLPLLLICHVLFGSGYVFLFSWSFARGKLTCVNLEPGGTRYILGRGGAEKPLIPWPCLRQKSLIFLPCLRHLTRNHTLCKTIINIETLSYLIHWQSQNYLQLFKTKIDKIDTLIKTSLD